MTHVRVRNAIAVGIDLVLDVDAVVVGCDGVSVAIDNHIDARAAERSCRRRTVSEPVAHDGGEARNGELVATRDQAGGRRGEWSQWSRRRSDRGGELDRKLIEDADEEQLATRHNRALAAGGVPHGVSGLEIVRLAEHDHVTRRIDARDARCQRERPAGMDRGAVECRTEREPVVIDLNHAEVAAVRQRRRLTCPRGDRRSAVE